ncbi:transcriptional activator [Krasilnikovia cinnamomea]|uniref:Transcriptional activator n=1 Tax=Krasilnikovia cinnamomea TaxID=349313 RepID=A0A4Q7ZGV0_9ACTN|nr:BTAD domain-containing putative transcriptional regulator [Krasilnikovia cinnamomea]RZU49375.1 transcriptional activator [Krasilnikovia cinnamomea]
MTIAALARDTDRVPSARGADVGDRVALAPHYRSATARTRLRFTGFGVFRADIDGARVLLPPISRTMLARLVLARGGLVYADDLYRDCWSDPTAVVRREQRVAVHKRIGELRRCLAPGPDADGTALLVTERSARTGYRLLLDDDQVDLHVFADLVYRAAAVQDVVAVDLLMRSLAMWTEPPLLGLPDAGFVRDRVSWLTQLRDRACRELAVACRALGRGRDARAAFDRLQARHSDDAGLRQAIDRLRGDR